MPYEDYYDMEPCECEEVFHSSKEAIDYVNDYNRRSEEEARKKLEGVQ